MNLPELVFNQRKLASIGFYLFYTALHYSSLCAKLFYYMNQNIFREYDIRGIVGRDLTDETVYTIGKAIGTFFNKNGAKRIAVGLRRARKLAAISRFTRQRF
jgi:hypothetical protein